MITLRRSTVFARPFFRSVQTRHPPKSIASNTSVTNETPTAVLSNAGRDSLAESVAAGEASRHQQAPNRSETWTKSQRPRSLAMTGPRFEQTIIEQQPAPWAAIELIHKQPIKWSDKRVVTCNGGGGPMGHPRIFINVDKPGVVPCGYCGLPYAYEHNRQMLLETGVDYPLN